MTPQAAYPGGQSPHAVPIAYCPELHPGVVVGVCEGATTFRDGVRDCVAAASSRSAWWVGVLVGVDVDLGDLVGVGFRVWEAVGLRVRVPDLVGLPVAFGDLVELIAMHAPQVVDVYPAAHGPEKKGAQEEYPTGHGDIGVGVRSLDPAGVLEGGNVADADGVEEPTNVVLGVTADFRTATLRAVMVALDTPASLASQE